MCIYKNLPGGRSATSIRLAADVRVLILIAEVEAEVVDDVPSVFDDVGPLVGAARGGLAAEVLEPGEVVGVGGGRQPGEDALMGEEVGPGADGQEGPLAGRVLLLELGERADEAEGLRLLRYDGLCVAAEDDQDVKLGQSGVGFLPRHLRGDDDTLAGERLGLAASECDFEGLASCCGLTSTSSRSALPCQKKHAPLRGA